jgi:uncharacterized protein YecE (DUF72 family)
LLIGCVMPDLRIGLSGWRYREWRGPFYPPGLRQADELAYAAARFRSLEINGSFYSLQRPSSYETWHAQTPDDFVFAVKGGRFITHMKKLRDVHEALANFFASGVLKLKHKLGPVLWQFPENMPADLARFEAFFELLPRDMRSAARLARAHAEWMGYRSATRALVDRPIRHAIELRNPACATREFIALLRRHEIALVIADTAGRFPFVSDVTADFVYVRLHGDAKLYASKYERRALERWAHRIRMWRSGREPGDGERVAPAMVGRRPRDVYVYFDNDMYAHAPRDALMLRQLLEGPRGMTLAPLCAHDELRIQTDERGARPQPTARKRAARGGARVRLRRNF